MLCRDLFIREFGNARALGSVFDGDGADVALGVDIQHRVFIKITSLSNGLVPKFDVQSVGVGEIPNLHGLNPRSKNALWTVSPSESSTTRRNLSPASGTALHGRIRRRPGRLPGLVTRPRVESTRCE